MDALIRLSPGRRVPPLITELTGITDAELEAKGWEKEAACRRFCQMLVGDGPVLMVAYNAQFDLNFLYRMLRPFGLAEVLKAPRFLDALTVYRDRRPYPHKLENAIAAYRLTEVKNSHRAVDDARAAAALLEAMSREREDLPHYIDLFGTHPRYGVSGQKIASVTYLPQPYQSDTPLYASLPTES